jgi:hypothetical protein
MGLIHTVPSVGGGGEKSSGKKLTLYRVDYSRKTSFLSISGYLSNGSLFPGSRKTASRICMNEQPESVILQLSCIPRAFAVPIRLSVIPLPVHLRHPYALSLFVWIFHRFYTLSVLPPVQESNGSLNSSVRAGKEGAPFTA